VEFSVLSKGLLRRSFGGLIFLATPEGMPLAQCTKTPKHTKILTFKKKLNNKFKQFLKPFNYYAIKL